MLPNSHVHLCESGDRKQSDRQTLQELRRPRPSGCSHGVGLRDGLRHVTPPPACCLHARHPRGSSLAQWRLRRARELTVWQLGRVRVQDRLDR